jgi:hypothetical protein
MNWELARQQSTTAIHDAGAFLTADNLAKLMLTDADQLRKQLADWQDRGEIFSFQDAAEGDLFPVLRTKIALACVCAMPIPRSQKCSWDVDLRRELRIDSSVSAAFSMTNCPRICSRKIRTG